MNAHKLQRVTNQELFAKTLVSLVVMESLFTSMARKTTTSALYLTVTFTSMLTSSVEEMRT